MLNVPLRPDLCLKSRVSGVFNELSLSNSSATTLGARSRLPEPQYKPTREQPREFRGKSPLLQQAQAQGCLEPPQQQSLSAQRGSGEPPKIREPHHRR